MTPRSRFDADPEAEATIEALRRRYQQQPRERHFGWLGLLIAVFLGYLFAHFSDGSRSTPDSAERYRAAGGGPMPGPTSVVRDYAPRAELVQNDFAPRPVGGAFAVQMPDGRHVGATVRYACGWPERFAFERQPHWRRQIRGWRQALVRLADSIGQQRPGLD
jgi:hypothetical protein